MTKVFIDTETTGLDPKSNSVFQISGIIEYTDDNNVTTEEVFDFKMKPYMPNDRISKEAYVKTGVSQAELDSYPDSHDVVNQFISLLDKYIDTKKPETRAIFIGYNSRFDWDFLFECLKFHKVSYLTKYFFFPYIDVMTLAAVYLMKERPNMVDFKQITVYETLFNKLLENAHNALADVEACKAIYDKVTSANAYYKLSEDVKVREKNPQLKLEF